MQSISKYSWYFTGCINKCVNFDLYIVTSLLLCRKLKAVHYTMHFDVQLHLSPTLYSLSVLQNSS